MKKKNIEEEIKEETPITEEKIDDDIEEMVNEKKRNTKDLTDDINKAKKKLKEELENTKIFDPKKADIKNKKVEKIPEKKKCNKDLNIIGEIDLICIGYYIYMLLFTKYNEFNYLVPGYIIIFIVLLFGISLFTNRKIRNILNIINLISVIAFITYIAYYLI